jgi:hypothetical protein
VDKSFKRLRIQYQSPQGGKRRGANAPDPPTNRGHSPLAHQRSPRNTSKWPPRAKQLPPSRHCVSDRASPSPQGLTQPPVDQKGGAKTDSRFVVAPTRSMDRGVITAVSLRYMPSASKTTAGTIKRALGRDFRSTPILTHWPRG